MLLYLNMQTDGGSMVIKKIKLISTNINIFVFLENITLVVISRRWVVYKSPIISNLK